MERIAPAARAGTILKGGRAVHGQGGRIGHGQHALPNAAVHVQCRRFLFSSGCWLFVSVRSAFDACCTVWGEGVEAIT